LSRRTIFFVSDQTGVTAETMGHSLLTQFKGLDYRTVTLPFVNTVADVQEAARRIVWKTAHDPSCLPRWSKTTCVRRSSNRPR
jgi:regulator of PEP synthase PpsR (kinase-PPPase family)